MDELRGWVHDWLEGFRRSRELQIVLSLPIPYPSHPLPIGFPFEDFSLWQRFEWIHEYGTEQLRHIHSVDFFFHGRTNGLGSSVAWKVATADGIELGVFEIAGPIYADDALPFRIDTDLVLEGILASLAQHTPVHLASRLVSVPNVQSHAPPQTLQVYELRTPTQQVICQVGARLLP
ncbi:hypothetical protein C8R43DRAFT_1140048 [Mycena crocata]|nr:hypothetical protein C8R43DRAFT_1140048 [Mycena crocata]